jgi:hypothetical protein
VAPAPGSPRSVVAAALAGTGYTIVTGRWPENITAPTLVIATREIRPGPVQGNLTWVIPVYVLTALKGDTAEDDLEVALLRVVAALAAAQPLVLTGGTRAAVADDSYNAFGLDVEVYTPAPPTS